MSGSRLEFFLGGNDLEMEAVRALLSEVAGTRVHDHHLGWGARASDYGDEIREALAREATPVLVELEDDLGLPPHRVRTVDHHGPGSGGQRGALRQVFELLDLPEERWDRELELIAANDRAHVRGLRELGATSEEIARIRRADRAAQGISEEEERAGEQAVARAERLAGGALTVVRLPHAKAATVTDRLVPELGGPGYENLLVLSPGEVNFYGDGDLVRELERAYPGGWSGGELPVRGFWGRRGEMPGIVEWVGERLSSRSMAL